MNELKSNIVIFRRNPLWIY